MLKTPYITCIPVGDVVFPLLFPLEMLEMLRSHAALKSREKMKVTLMKNYQKWFSSLFIRKRRKKKKEEEILHEYLCVLPKKGSNGEITWIGGE